MWCRFDNNDTISKTGTLQVKSCVNNTVAFYVNDIHYQSLSGAVFCNKKVDFRAEVENLHPDPESLKWYINGVEEVGARDRLTWSKILTTKGVYEIKLWVRFGNGKTMLIKAQ
jgi:hypothetical protein